MRDTLVRLVDTAESFGYFDRTFFTDWFQLVVVGLSVVDKTYIRFADDERIAFIFVLLEAEGLIELNPRYQGEHFLGKPVYHLTSFGKYLAEEFTQVLRRKWH